MKKIILILLGLLFVFWAYVMYSFSSIWSIIIEPQTLEIEKWETVSNLVTKLKLDVNPMIYKIWVKLNYWDFRLQNWKYDIKEKITLDGLFKNVLSKPTKNDVTITILPGRNIFDIDDYLTEKWVIKGWELEKFSDEISLIAAKSDMKSKEFLDNYPFLLGAKSLEWFLYPDTYNIDPKWDLEKITWVLLDQFKKKIYANYKWSKDDFYKTLILASIVEKEERDPTNKPIVAWILKTRLENWIAIWADVTICYSYKKPYSDCDPEFIGQNIHKKSEYNTRAQRWLTPTPISNVSENTFDSTLNSSSTSYLYYLHDSEWNIHFATSLDEHVLNKQKYLK